MVDKATERIAHLSGLTPRELALICGVLRRIPEVKGAVLFGSRAKGTAGPGSDIDLALEGIDDPLEAAAATRELEELPLPYRFDVTAIEAVKNPALLEHIERIGIRIFNRD